MPRRVGGGAWAQAGAKLGTAMRGIGQRPSTAALALAAFGLACGDDAAPEPVAVHGPGQDAAVLVDGATPPVPVRPDDPRFPAADQQITLPPGERVTVSLRLDAGVGALDVQLSIDTTESMSEEIDNLQRELSQSIVPGLLDRVADVRFGVSRFEDFPAAPFGFAGDALGNPADTPFRLLTPITDDRARVSSAVASLDRPLGSGGDVPEASAEALWQIATGEGYRAGSETIVEPFESSRASSSDGEPIGGVGFRAHALRVVLHVTDAPSHAPRDYAGVFADTHSLEQAATALKEIDTRIVGIVTRPCVDDACDTGDPQARRDLELVAFATDTIAPVNDDELCPHGVDGTDVQPYRGVCPLVYDVRDDGSHLSDTLVDAIAALVDSVRFGEVHGEPNADPLGFVQSIVAVQVPQDRGVETPTAADALPVDAPDGILDTFRDVRRKAALRFDVTLMNRNVTPSDVAQRFRVVVRIVGDGVVLQERVLRVIVPPFGSATVDASVADADGG